MRKKDLSCWIKLLSAKAVANSCVFVTQTLKQACQARRWQIKAMTSVFLKRSVLPVFTCLHVSTEKGVYENLHPGRSFQKGPFSVT